MSRSSSYIFLILSILATVAACDDPAKQQAQEAALIQSRLLER
jgi:hypothetical protein